MGFWVAQRSSDTWAVMHGADELVHLFQDTVIKYGLNCTPVVIRLVSGAKERAEDYARWSNENSHE